MKKLWEKNTGIDSLMEKFTIGNDQSVDMVLAPHDIRGSLAHARMLAHVGLITKDECSLLETGLFEIEQKLQTGEFYIREGVEDIHTQIELYLTERLGEVGKKIHTGRSRNDQVLTAIKLYLKTELHSIRNKTITLQRIYKQLADKYTGIPLPGYTHFQVAMPSTFSYWFGAYSESLCDDLEVVDAAIKICDKNPLGSAAGYGTNLNIDKEFTTRELGFASYNDSPVYAQMTRGKSEKIAATAISAVAATISKFSYDVCLYLCQNFAFISFPDSVTTGSSIMPHKKNPDIFELLRGKCNLLQDLPNRLAFLGSNLPSGYHRDFQLTKSEIISGITSMKECLDILTHVLPMIQVKEGILTDEKYRYIHSVDAVNALVADGVPFREAYAIIAAQIENGSFNSGVQSTVPDAHLS